MNLNFRSRSFLIALFILWILPGLFGRDPWKADEPYSFGLAYNIIQTGDWVVPTLVDEPFLEKPPLFYLTAAGFGKLLSPWMTLHDATRVACILFMLLTLLFLSLAAGELFGRERRATAAVLLIGCLHLQVTAHKLITDLALLAGLAIALYGLALIKRRPVPGGFWLGTGAGVGFLSKGLLAPGVLAVSVVILLVVSPLWRARRYLFPLVIAFAAALPWLAIWPAALYHRSPDLFREWFWYQNMGRFFGFANATQNDTHSFYIRNLVWLTWPVLPLALWTIWRERNSFWKDPACTVPLAVFFAMLGVLSASASVRALYALPLLLPLVLLAVPGAFALPDRARTTIRRASILFFGLLAAADWFFWLSFMTGRPRAASGWLQNVLPGVDPAANALLACAAVVLCGAWLFSVLGMTRSAEDAVHTWTLGVVFVWGLTMALWLPALDAATSDRSIFLSLQRALPASAGNVDSFGLGDSERAMLDYVTGIHTTRVETRGLGKNALLLVQCKGVPWEPGSSRQWKKLWASIRSDGGSIGSFALYQRIGRAPGDAGARQITVRNRPAAPHRQPSAENG